MNFLSPWFLAGAALIAGPIIFHLIQRRTKEKVRFSATQFLSESAPRLQKKSRIQNPWLLLIRCLIVALLAMAFARPFLNNESQELVSVAPGKSHIILIDESASMLRADLFQRAIDQAKESATALDPTDRVAVYVFSDTIEQVISFEQWTAVLPNARQALIEKELSERKPSWNSTSLGFAIDATLAEFDQLKNDAGLQQEHSLTVISDFAKGSRITELANTEWPENLSLDFKSIAPSKLGNLSLQWLGWSEKSNDSLNARIAVRSDGFSELQAGTLRLKDATSGLPIGDTLEIKVLPDDRQLVLIPIPLEIAGPFELQLDGDQLGYDNQLYFAKDQVQEVSLNYLGIDSIEDSKRASFYLSRAIAGWKQPLASFESNRLETDQIQNALHIVDTPLDKKSSDSLRGKMENGDYVIVLADTPEKESILNELTQTNGWSIHPSMEEYALLGTIDFNHPQFAPFSNPKFNDFSKIRFWSPPTIQIPNSIEAKTIARFDNRNPAIIEMEIGKGKLLVWSGNWTPQSSQWVLSSKFVPWLKTLAERTIGGLPDSPIQDIATFAPTSLSSEAIVQDAEGSKMDSTPNSPGLYQVIEDGRNHWLALNTPLQESFVSSYNLDDWERMGIPFSPEAMENNFNDTENDKRDLTSIELESQQKLWRWVIIIATILLATESIIAIILGKRDKEAMA